MLSTDDFIEFVVLRNSQEYTLKVKPNLVEGDDHLGNKIKKRMVGIKLCANNNNINHVKLGPIEAIYYSVKEIFFVSQKTLEIVWGYAKIMGPRLW